MKFWALLITRAWGLSINVWLILVILFEKELIFLFKWNRFRINHIISEWNFQFLVIVELLIKLFCWQFKSLSVLNDKLLLSKVNSEHSNCTSPYLTLQNKGVKDFFLSFFYVRPPNFGNNCKPLQFPVCSHSEL